VKKLLELGGVEEDKVRRKNRPTFMLMADDRVVKIGGDLIYDSHSLPLI
jgi:hypothetical protein